METDKNKTGLFKEYEIMFSSVRNNPIKYLEIGIRGGDSLVWAKNYFSNGQIVGVDIRLPSEIQGVTMLKADQNDTNTLTEIGLEYGNFDIIIDDGSHYAKETENTFNVLFPFLKKGGIYIIEDWMAYIIGDKYKGMDSLMIKLISEHGGHIVKLKDNTGSYTIIIK